MTGAQRWTKRVVEGNRKRREKEGSERTNCQQMALRLNKQFSLEGAMIANMKADPSGHTLTLRA
jgi:hypothetical protein